MKDKYENKYRELLKVLKRALLDLDRMGEEGSGPKVMAIEGFSGRWGYEIDIPSTLEGDQNLTKVSVPAGVPVIIDKKYGPLATNAVRIRLNTESAEWVVDCEEGQEWVEKARWGCQAGFPEPESKVETETVTYDVFQEPCHFCGSVSVELWQVKETGLCFVVCQMCGLTGPRMPDKWQAQTVWNSLSMLKAETFK